MDSQNSKTKRNRIIINYARRSLGFSAQIDFAPTAKNAPFREFLSSLDTDPTPKTYYREEP